MNKHKILNICEKNLGYFLRFFSLSIINPIIKPSKKYCIIIRKGIDSSAISCAPKLEMKFDTIIAGLLAKSKYQQSRVSPPQFTPTIAIRRPITPKIIPLLYQIFRTLHDLIRLNVILEFICVNIYKYYQNKNYEN